MLENSPQTPTKGASNQKEDKAEITGLPAGKEAEELMGEYKLKTSTQLDIDRQTAISREAEMVGWMAASLGDSQSHYWFFSAQKRRRK